MYGGMLLFATLLSLQQQLRHHVLADAALDPDCERTTKAGGVCVVVKLSPGLPGLVDSFVGIGKVVRPVLVRNFCLFPSCDTVSAIADVIAPEKIPRATPCRPPQPSLTYTDQWKVDQTLINLSRSNLDHLRCRLELVQR
jgi:hypothetical protein